jgi:hypothetical protein
VTCGFREPLGRGVFGTVFQGTLLQHNGGEKAIAVKRLEKVVEEGEREFQREVHAIGQASHRNLVSGARRARAWCARGRGARRPRACAQMGASARGAHHLHPTRTAGERTTGEREQGRACRDARRPGGAIRRVRPWRRATATQVPQTAAAGPTCRGVSCPRTQSRACTRLPPRGQRHSRLLCYCATGTLLCFAFAHVEYVSARSCSSTTSLSLFLSGDGGRVRQAAVIARFE